MSHPDPTDPLSPPPDAIRSAIDGGELCSWQPRADVAANRVSGVMTLSLARCFEAFYTPVFARGRKMRIFVDLEAVTLYTREGRERMTAFTLEHLEQIEVIHVYLRSKLVAMGLGAFKHGVGDVLVRSYTDRASFLRSYQEAIGRS